MFLEEYRFKVQERALGDLIQVLNQISGIEITALTEQLVIVDNDTFRYLSQYATPVTAHIAIDNDKKTVKKGMLWYEETLPPETVFYCALSANKARAVTPETQGQWQAETILNNLQAETILKSITETLFADSPYLQLGGNETVGMGWCKITVKGA